MWHRVNKDTPPQREIVWLMLWGGVEIMAQFDGEQWWHGNSDTRVRTTPTHWKRMGQ